MSLKTDSNPAHFSVSLSSFSYRPECCLVLSGRIMLDNRVWKSCQKTSAKTTSSSVFRTISVCLFFHVVVFLALLVMVLSVRYGDQLWQLGHYIIPHDAAVGQRESPRLFEKRCIQKYVNTVNVRMYASIWTCNILQQQSCIICTLGSGGVAVKEQTQRASSLDIGGLNHGCKALNPMLL